MSTEQTAVIGLTGGIASGKSFVASLFEDHGVIVIDADVLARVAVEPGSEALAQIVAAFGTDVINSDGTMNRAHVGEIVFSNRERLEALNAIVHPKVADLTSQKVVEANESGIPWVVYNAALIVENGLQSGLDGLIVVKCDRQIQLERLTKRDGFSMTEAAQRVDSQLPLDKKIGVADWVVDNNGTGEQTRNQIASLCMTLNDLFGNGDSP